MLGPLSKLGPQQSGSHTGIFVSSKTNVLIFAALTMAMKALRDLAAGLHPEINRTVEDPNFIRVH